MSNRKQIPFNRYEFGEAEYEYIRDAVARGHISGDGHYSRLCEDKISSITQSSSCLLTTSCTHALEMVALLLDICPGDEVVLPSYTFASTATAFAMRGAILKFVDIRKDTLNIDEKCVMDVISDKTKAIVAVHYAGVGCEMNALSALAKQSCAHLIEDNAHGLFGRFNSKPLGSFGTFSTFSFHETKNISCGEGGALVINDDSFLERAEIIREKGTNRRGFRRGLVDKYNWVDIGSSYVQSEILSSILWAQLERAEAVQNARMKIWTSYASHLENWASANGVKLPSIPELCSHPAHLFYLLMPDANSRDRFLSHSRNYGILSVFHYLPLHLSPFGMKYGFDSQSLPITEQVSSRLVRLPLYHALKESEVNRVIDMVLAFKP